MRRRTAPGILGLAGLAAIVAGVLVWLAWQRFLAPRPIRPGTCAGCNVLLITIDTLRTDRVGAFGGPPNLTPALDRLAAEGLRFTRAYSSAPLTLPSHTSIMTGVSPPIHGVRTNGLFRLGPRLPTLGTILRAQGYRTGAFVGAFVLDARFGLDRGFDVYDDRYGERHPGDDTDEAERRAEEVVTPAAAWILGAPQARPGVSAGAKLAGSRWFAWVHLYDPHEPYRAPEPYASQHQPYDAEVAYTDAMIGRLLDGLKTAGQLDRTLVVVAADHGESLGEHGERTHGVFAYEVTLRVPWIIWAGRQVDLPRGRAFDGPVRLIDLAPTVLELLGVAPPASFEGRSVLAAVNERAVIASRAHEASSPLIYFEAMDANLTRNWAPLTGVISGGFKLIDLPLPELYDLASDPQETRNLYSQEPERTRTLEALLGDAKARFAILGRSVTGRGGSMSGRGGSAPRDEGGPLSERATLDDESRRRLQALGYVASSAEPGQRVYTEADDPKHLVGAADELNRALNAFRAAARDRSPAGRDARAATADMALATVRQIIHEHPGFTTAYGVLATMQREIGDLAGAIATLENAVRGGMADPSVMVVLAGYLQEAGRLDKSADLLETIIAAHPDYAEAYNSLGVVSTRLGRHDRARAALMRLLELDPTSAKGYENLGVDDLAAGDVTGAIRDLTRALDLDPRLAGAHNALAAVYARQGRQDEAIAEWRTAVQLDPRLYDALYNLATALHAIGRRDEARPYLQRFADEAPPAQYGPDIARLRALLAS